MPKDKIVWNLKDIKYAKFFTYDLESFRSTINRELVVQDNYCKCSTCRMRQLDYFWENDKKLSLYLVWRAVDKIEKNNKVTKYLKW